MLKEPVLKDVSGIRLLEVGITSVNAEDFQRSSAERREKGDKARVEKPDEATNYQIYVRSAISEDAADATQESSGTARYPPREGRVRLKTVAISSRSTQREQAKADKPTTLERACAVGVPREDGWNAPRTGRKAADIPKFATASARGTCPIVREQNCPGLWAKRGDLDGIQQPPEDARGVTRYSRATGRWFYIAEATADRDYVTVAAGSPGWDDSSNVAIIKEVYDNENAHETFEYELERALESECSLIVIEPSKLGDETSRWIAVGNCLHKTAALSGLAAITTGLIWGDQPYICGPLGFISVISCGLYTVSWQFDPCCQYQVETDTSKLPHKLLAALGPSLPTFLVRKDDTRRRILHTTITLVALSISAWRVYQAFK
ncbi:Transmembrane protein 11, mitochondrial [Eufriesea mexicana]|uniref:Transmembrane protein 11, mitochondrial n=1 Tax=Eufriesea mexicana TaxID=516756 RepID=A0A310SNV0_9HYME|nr:Transmembrane protein 11, mitochondrial [Eufriesea mexicana]